MSQTENTQKKILEQIEVLLSPLVLASSSPTFRNQLFENLGWDLRQTDILPFSFRFRILFYYYLRERNRMKMKKNTMKNFALALTLALIFVPDKRQISNENLIQDINTLLY